MNVTVKVRRPVSSVRSRDISVSVLTLIIVAAAILVGFELVRHTPPPSSPPTKSTAAVPPPKPAPQPTLSSGQVVASLPPKPPDDTSVKLPPPVIPDSKAAPGTDTGSAALWKKALAERDRAIATGNFTGARRAISAFLAAHPEGEQSQQAQRELADTQKLIEAALVIQFNDMVKAIAQNNFRLAVQRCTRIIASDPSGKFGADAREIMTHIDGGTEPRFIEFNKRAITQLEAGQLDQAGETLEQALDALGGTKWAEQISALQLQVLMAQALMNQIKNQSIKSAAEGKPVSIKLIKKRLSGTLAGATGLALDLNVGDRIIAVPIKELTPEELQSVLKQMRLQENHMELAYLWLLLKKIPRRRPRPNRRCCSPNRPPPPSAW